MISTLGLNSKMSITRIEHMKDKDLKKSLKKSLKKIWNEVYDEYWVRVHCNVSKIKDINENMIEIIRCKQKIVKFFYSSSHSYITQTKQKIEEYERLSNV